MSDDNKREFGVLPPGVDVWMRGAFLAFHGRCKLEILGDKSGANFSAKCVEHVPPQEYADMCPPECEAHEHVCRMPCLKPVPKGEKYCSPECAERQELYAQMERQARERQKVAPRPRPRVEPRRPSIGDRRPANPHLPGPRPGRCPTCGQPTNRWPH